jgi:hypothetical protein
MQNTLAILSDKRPEGWVLINEEDFDPAVHVAKINGQQVILVPLDFTAMHITAGAISEYQLKVADPNLGPSEVLEIQEPIETPEALINEPQVRKSGRPRK